MVKRLRIQLVKGEVKGLYFLLGEQYERDDKPMNEFGYFSKYVAMELRVTTSTLRRWSIELEKCGYNIERNEKEQRIY